MTDKAPQITVHRFLPADPTIFDPSPFVNKLECLLRMSSTPYALTQTNVRKAPLHKLPFISLSTGAKIPDSTLAYKYLVQHNLATDLDSALTPLERAQSNAIQQWLENWIYFLWCWEKYIDNWRLTRSTMFALFIPFTPLRVIVYHFIYKNFSSMFYNMGITRHPREQILRFIREAVETLAVLVGETGVFAGKKCGLDAVVFGILVGIREAGEMTPVWGEEVGKYPNLTRWVEEKCKEYFPERTLRQSIKTRSL